MPICRKHGSLSEPGDPRPPTHPEGQKGVTPQVRAVGAGEGGGRGEGGGHDPRRPALGAADLVVLLVLTALSLRRGALTGHWG